MDEFAGNRGLYRAVKLLSMILQMVGTCHYTCVKTHRPYNTNNEPLCKPWHGW